MMKTINKSEADTNVLRKIFRKTLRYNTKLEMKPIKKLTVVITNSRRSMRVSGRAHVGGWKVRMIVSKDAKPSTVAAVFFHELQHIRGYDHKVLGTKVIYKDDFQWANAYSL